MKVWTASQTLSTYGILSATNSITNRAMRETEHHRMGEHLQLGREVDDAEPLEQPDGRDGRVEIEPRGERGAEGEAEGLERRHAAKAIRGGGGDRRAVTPASRPYPADRRR